MRLDMALLSETPPCFEKSSFVVLLLALLSEATTACAEKRIALVVGNSLYHGPPWLF